MKKTLFAMVLALAACGGSDPGTPAVDAPPVGTGIDAPGTHAPDAAVTMNTMITISGVASTISTGGKVPTEGIMIVAKKVSDDSTIAMTTSAATTGAFSITAPTNGTAVDAYLVATKSGDLDTYLYPPAPLTMDYANIPIYVMTSSTQSLADSIAGADAPNPADGWIGVVIQDNAMAAVAGATLTASPTGQIHYNGSAGLPQSQAMSTAADGTAYAMNVPAGNVTVGAMKAGATFKSHVINARAGKVTLTLVTE